MPDDDVSIDAVGHTIASIGGGPSLDDFDFDFDFDDVADADADADDGPFLLVGMGFALSRLVAVST